jgi:hypothetical protein
MQFIIIIHFSLSVPDSSSQKASEVFSMSNTEKSAKQPCFCGSRNFRYVIVPKSTKIAIFTGFVHIKGAIELYGAVGHLRLKK